MGADRPRREKTCILRYSNIIVEYLLLDLIEHFPMNMPFTCIVYTCISTHRIFLYIYSYSYNWLHTHTLHIYKYIYTSTKKHIHAISICISHISSYLDIWMFRCHAWLQERTILAFGAVRMLRLPHGVGCPESPSGRVIRSWWKFLGSPDDGTPIPNIFPFLVGLEHQFYFPIYWE